LVVSAADADGECSVHPLFRCNVSLNIPTMSVEPTLDEVQVAVVQAVQLILGSLKSVESWSITFNSGAELDQQPTTPATAGPVTGSVVTV